MNKKVILAGVLLLVLTIGVGAGVYFGVNRNQNLNSKATGVCGNMRWPADPTTACGTSTQAPAQNAANVSLIPNFHWDYGGYRPEDNGQCVQPSGCATYSVSVYLSEGSSTAKAFARADIPQGTTQATPVKDAPFSQFVLCDYTIDPNTCHTDRQPTITTLKPNTTYFWKVTPFFNGVVHAEQTWIYTFTTGAGTQTVGCNQTCDATHLCPSELSCDTVSGTCRKSDCSTQTSCVCPVTPPVSIDCVSLTTTADLNNLQIGQLYTFSLTVSGPATSIVMPVYFDNSCTTLTNNTAPYRASGPGTYTTSWRPTRAGPFVAYGQVNAGTTSCQSDCGGTLCTGAASCKLTGMVKTQTVGCNQTCDATHLCPSNLTCDTTSGTCRNSACSTQTSCVCPVTPPVAACQKVTASKDLSTVKIGDTVTFTGYGTLSNQAADDSIDMIRFAIASTSGTLTQDVNTTLDSAGVWKATLDYLIKGASSYTVTIQAHWKSTNQWLP